MPPEPEKDITDDAALGGRLRLFQPRKGHRFGHDAILLAAAAHARPGDHVVELGAGVGAAALAVARRVPEVRLTLVERDRLLASLAAQNIERNGFKDRAAVACLDVADAGEVFAEAGLAPACADIVIMNPPFHDPARLPQSPDERRRTAHSGDRKTLAIWVRAARCLLRRGGLLTSIYRADGLEHVMATLSPEFGGVVILPILPKQDAQPIRVIVQATKGDHAPPQRLQPLALNDVTGRPTVDAEEVLRHAAALNLGA